MSTSFEIDLSSQQIIDDYGRSMIFHGVNAVEKKAPYLPFPTGGIEDQSVLSDDDAALLEGWGFNVVRLGVLWAGVMPSEGEVNTTYLSNVKSMIEMLAERGVYTLVDMHQDVLSETMCGEGIPAWALAKGLASVGFNASDPAKAFPAPLPYDIPTDPSTGYPSVEGCMENSFFLYYTSFESEATWRSLYSVPDMQAALGDHWRAVANHLQGTNGLLGYEMINEPWPARGSGANPNRVLSDANTLGNLYDVLHAAVRGVDANALFFFEPLVLGSYEESVLQTLTTDFPPGGPGADAATGLGDGKSVFAYHSYCPSNPDGSPAYMRLCRKLVGWGWDAVGRNLGHLGPSVGGFLTEFGAVGNDSDSLELLQLQASGADSLLQGWAYWTYKSFDDVTTQNQHTETFFNEDGSLQLGKIKALARTYARAIAGKPTAMSFDPSTAKFKLDFTATAVVLNGKANHNPADAAAAGGGGAVQGSRGSGGSEGVAATTEVFLHQGFYYPNGFAVTLTPPEGVSWSVLRNGTGGAGTGGAFSVLGITVLDPNLVGAAVSVAIGPV